MSVRSPIIATLCALGGLATATASLAQETLEGRVAAVSGPIVTVEPADGGEPVFVKTATPLAASDVGRTVTVACDLVGDLCVATSVTFGG